MFRELLFSYNLVEKKKSFQLMGFNGNGMVCHAYWFTSEINLALDECAPIKRIKIRDNYKPGLSQATKDLLRERVL